MIKNEPINNEEFNIEFLNPGNYILQVVMDSDIHNIKLVKN